MPLGAIFLAAFGGMGSANALIDAGVLVGAFRVRLLVGLLVFALLGVGCLLLGLRRKGALQRLYFVMWTLMYLLISGSLQLTGMWDWPFWQRALTGVAAGSAAVMVVTLFLLVYGRVPGAGGESEGR
jgi:hypothetical protein